MGTYATESNGHHALLPQYNFLSEFGTRSPNIPLTEAEWEITDHEMLEGNRNCNDILRIKSSQISWDRPSIRGHFSCGNLVKASQTSSRYHTYLNQDD